MLKVNLHKYAPGLPEQLVTAVQNNAGAVYSAVPDVCPFTVILLAFSPYITDFAHLWYQALRPQVLKAYMKTLSAVFVIGVPCSALAIVGALFMDTTKMDMSHGAPTAVAAKPADIEQGSTTEAGDDDPADGEKKSAGAPSLDPPPAAKEGTLGPEIEKA